MKAELVVDQPSDLHYLGGLIDADGHIGLHMVSKKEGRYAPSISFVNTDYDLILLFKRYLGGKIYIKNKLKPNHQTTYEVIIRNNKEFLDAAILISDYLRIKKKKLLVAKQYAETIRDLKGRKRTPEVIQLRRSLREIWENTKIEM